MKKLLAFDLDDTLAVTKSPISDEMVAVMTRVAAASATSGRAPLSVPSS